MVDPFTDLKTACHALAKNCGPALAWSWDGRFGAALATFPATQAAAVLAAVSTVLPLRWDLGTIGQAASAVQAKVQAIGGLRDGQFVLATPADQDVLLVAAWWPWGGGQTISIRVFPVPAGLFLVDHDALVAAFRSGLAV